MSTMQQHLDDLAPTRPVRTFAEQLAQRTAVESGRASTYVSLRPSLSGAIAVYAHRDRVSISVPPERIAGIATQFPGAITEYKGPTTYVRLEDALLAKHATAALDLAVEAVSWRAQGPTSTLGGHAKKPPKVALTCPEHWYELSPSGACPECG